MERVRTLQNFERSAAAQSHGVVRSSVAKAGRDGVSQTCETVQSGLRRVA